MRTTSSPRFSSYKHFLRRCGRCEALIRWITVCILVPSLSWHSPWFWFTQEWREGLEQRVLLFSAPAPLLERLINSEQWAIKALITRLILISSAACFLNSLSLKAGTGRHRPGDRPFDQPRMLCVETRPIPMLYSSFSWRLVTRRQRKWASCLHLPSNVSSANLPFCFPSRVHHISSSPSCSNSLRTLAKCF